MSHHTHPAFALRGFKDAEERERLVSEHLPQVKYIARRIHDRLPSHVPMDDLVHAGVVGLIDAVEKCDPSKNAQLRYYAKFRIRASLRSGIRELGSCTCPVTPKTQSGIMAFGAEPCEFCKSRSRTKPCCRLSARP